MYPALFYFIIVAAIIVAKENIYIYTHTLILVEYEVKVRVKQKKSS